MPRSLLDHILEGFRRVQDIGNYLEWMMKGLKKSGALEEADKVTRAIFVSTRQAINNLNATSSVCNTNVTSFRRQEVISALRTNLPDDALLKLRETPFNSREPDRQRHLQSGPEGDEGDLSQRRATVANQAAAPVPPSAIVVPFLPRRRPCRRRSETPVPEVFW